MDSSLDLELRLRAAAERVRALRLELTGGEDHECCQEAIEEEAVVFDEAASAEALAAIRRVRDLLIAKMAATGSTSWLSLPPEN